MNRSSGDTIRAEGGSEKPHKQLEDRAASPVQDVHLLIAGVAHSLAERRGFQPGHELDDWLQAEGQIQSERDP